MRYVPMIPIVLATLLGAASPGAPAPRPLPAAMVADSAAALTVEGLTQIKTFWTAFTKEPDSIKTTGRQQHQKLLTLTLDIGNTGPLPMQDTVVDMVAMAAQYPAVAQALQQAGLTAIQWEQYRQALFTADLTAQLAQALHVTPDASSVVGKDVAFLAAHPKEVAALQATGMYFPPFQILQGSWGGTD